MIIENNILRTIAEGFKRSPKQRNNLLESDAEIIELKSNYFLAITVDGIVEEISTGLYEDPYLIGWMTVTASISDLAAVGAKPLGVLLNENIPYDYPTDKFKLIQKGINDACCEYDTYVLGGDTNNSNELQLTSIAIGSIEEKKLISRKGCSKNDVLLISNPMGSGMGFALNKMFYQEYNISYLPKPQIKYGEIIKKYGTACIDSSDGFFPAIANLIELNGIGFTITKEFDDFLDEQALDIASKTNTPSWFFLAGPHGEFELVFTIPSDKINEFLAEASKIEWSPIIIGSAIKKPILQYDSKEKNKILDVFAISNLFSESNGNPKAYMEALFKMHKKWEHH